MILTFEDSSLLFFETLSFFKDRNIHRRNMKFLPKNSFVSLDVSLIEFIRPNLIIRNGNEKKR